MDRVLDTYREGRSRTRRQLMTNEFRRVQRVAERGTHHRLGQRASCFGTEVGSKATHEFEHVGTGGETGKTRGHDALADLTDAAMLQLCAALAPI